MPSLVNCPSCQFPSLVESPHPTLKLSDLISLWLDSCIFVHHTELFQCQTSVRHWSNNSVTFHLFICHTDVFSSSCFTRTSLPILQAEARVSWSCHNLSTFSWILDPTQENHKAIDIQHGHSVPFSFFNHCIIMVGHGQLNIYYCLLVLFQGSFPDNCALACESVLQPWTLNVAFVFSHDKRHLVHPGSFNNIIMFAQYQRSIFLLLTCPSVFVSHNFVRTWVVFFHWQNYRVIEWFELKGTLKDHLLPIPLLWAGTPFNRSRWSKAHPT